ncbi:LIM-domain binding protein-domain-containing protein, partial [Cytidiella melzeri]
HLVGNGQSLLRLLQFSGVLAGDNAASHNSKLQLCFWEEIIKDYFTTRAVFKFTLWKENQRLEAKPFEIGVPILPRFFLVTAQSGVRCMTLNLDGARERTAGATHAIVECVQAIWTYRYWNGWTITLKGPLTAHIIVVPNVPSVSPTHAPGSYTLKFDQLVFDATTYERLLSFDVLPLHLPLSPASQNTPLPEDEHQPAQNNEVYLVHTEHEDRWQCDNLTFPIPPINGFGIPQATMRCLEVSANAIIFASDDETELHTQLAESVVQMSDLIRFSNDKKLGPKGTFFPKLFADGMSLTSFR